MSKALALTALCIAVGTARAAGPDVPVELHHRLQRSDAAQAQDVAITLDACGGAYDARLVALLVERRVPATIFITKRWLDRNPVAVRELRAHTELFELQNHGMAHVPAVVGSTRRLYGMAGEPDVAHLETEVTVAGDAIRQVTGQTPTYFRGAGAAYDAVAVKTIEGLGYRIAGFSVNADAGATLPATAVAARLRGVKPGDVVIAHMNKPTSGTAAGFAATLPELQQRGYRFVTLSQTRLVPQ